MGWKREISKSLHIQEQTACEAWGPIFEPNQPTTSPHSKSILFASSMDQSRWRASCNASTHQVLKNCPSKSHPGLTSGQRLSSVWVFSDSTTKTQKGADCLCPSLISGCRLHLSFRKWQWAMNFQFMISRFHHGASCPMLHQSLSLWIFAVFYKINLCWSFRWFKRYAMKIYALSCFPAMGAVPHRINRPQQTHPGQWLWHWLLPQFMLPHYTGIHYVQH